MTNARKAIKVRCIENGEVYNSYAEAGRAIGINRSSIRAVVLGEQESVKGLHFEAVEENIQEVEVLPSTVTNKQGETIPVIDSREVARMLGREHFEILRYIEGSNGRVGILATIQNTKWCSTDYFIESSYKDTFGRDCKCYLVTKKGCELIGNKQNGEKGTLFCLAYVERFNAMEKELKSKSVHQYPELTEKQQCILAIYDGGASAVTASKRLAEIEVQEATALLKEELTQSKADLTEKTEFIDGVNDCFPISQIVKDNKQLLRDRKDIVISPAKLNRIASELNMPVNKIDNPIEYSPYRRVNAYPRKVWMTAYPDIKLPEKENKKLPEKENK